MGDKMGSFLFKWPHPANKVYVTGTFDDWARSVELEKKGDGFEKLVELPMSNEKIYYKFVVDTNWVTDHTAPQEPDGENNVNNVLLPENITPPHSSSIPAAAGIMSGVTPQSTTAGLAGNVPKEADRGVAPEETPSDLPGTFPETPFHDADEFVPSLSKSAEDPQQTFGVAPLPATGGIGNPISLRPGEKVPPPSTFTDNTINTYVTTSKEAYENSTGAPQLPNVITPANEREAGAGMFDIPGITRNMIPESSLPMGGEATSEPDPGFMIQSAGANSTTAALAGQVPLEPRGVPEVVSESQQEANVEPEASANPEAVQEKTAMEKELESKVPEEPATSQGTGGEVAGMAAGGAVMGGATAAVASHGLPDSVQRSIHEINQGSVTAPTLPDVMHGSNQGASIAPTVPDAVHESNQGAAIAPTVPDVVQESIAESHQSPEAAGNKTMVEEKSAMEQQLLKEVPKEEDMGEPAPSSSAALAETAPAPTGTENVSPVANGSTSLTTAATPAQTPATGNAMKQAVQNQPDSRDISPMSKPIDPVQKQPTVTTGVGASSAPTTSQPTPQTADKAPAAVKPSPTSSSPASASTDKKSKRSSGFFGKLKAKVSGKHKE